MERSTTTRVQAALPTAKMAILTSANMLFLLICVLPVVYMFGSSFLGRDGGFTLANYSRIITESRQRGLLLTSGILGVGSALLAVLLGAPLGLLLARAAVPYRRFLRVLLSVPLVIPPYIFALTWIFITGPTGILAQAAGKDVVSSHTYTTGAAILVLGIAFYPIVMLATEAATRKVNGRLEEAGLLASPAPVVFRRITLPLVAPTVAAAALIVFILAVSEFGVPGLLRVRVFTTEVFTAFAALYDYGAATALSLPLMLLVLFAAIACGSVIGKQLVVVSRTPAKGIPVELGRFRPLLLFGVVLVVTVCVLLPILVLVREVTGIHQLLEAVAGSAVAIRNSLWLSLVGAAIVTALGLLLGYQRARTQSAFSTAQDLLFVLLFAVPSTVVGVGVIGLWNRPAIPVQIYASNFTVLVAYMARFVPVAALILAASTRQIHYSSEEAAQLAGVGWLRTFARVVIPQMLPGIAAAFVVTFVFVFGELGATVLVAPPGESTLPVRVYTLIANAPLSLVAALALIQTSVVLIPMGLLGAYAHFRQDAEHHVEAH